MAAATAPPPSVIGVFATKGPVCSVVAVSDDRIVSVGTAQDRSVCLWRVSDQSLLATFNGNSAAYFVLWLGGNRIATGHADHKVRLWNVDTQECLAVLEGHTQGVGSGVAVGGDRFVTCSVANMRLWSADTHTCLGVFGSDHNCYGIMAIAHMGDDRVATTSMDHCVRIWSVTTCTQILEIRRDFGDWYKEDLESPSSLLALDKDRILVGCYDGKCELWNATTGAYISSSYASPTGVDAGALLTPDMYILPYLSAVAVFNVHTGKLACKRATSSKERVLSLAVLPGNRVVVAFAKPGMELVQLPEDLSVDYVDPPAAPIVHHDPVAAPAPAPAPAPAAPVPQAAVAAAAAADNDDGVADGLFG